MAYLPPDLADITQNASACQILPPGASCQLVFTAGTNTQASTTFVISGDNTSPVNASLSVILPWITSGSVESMAFDVATNIIYLGGNFNYIGPNTRYAVPLDSNSAEVIPGFPYVNNIVYATISDGNGGWYIGGDFTRVGTALRNRIAYILADKSVDEYFNPNADSGVFALAINGSTVYAGGGFTSIGGQARNRIAALDATTGTANARSSDANNIVYTLAINGSTVYAGGNFTTISDQTRNRIAALDATTGIATTWNPKARNTVFVLTINGSTLYAGGNFSSINGEPRESFAFIPR